jgi:hypothetical protein
MIIKKEVDLAMQHSAKDFKLEICDEHITPRSGLVILFGEFVKALGVAAVLEKFLPTPRSCRGYSASAYVKSLLFLLYAGGTSVADLREIRTDKALRNLLGLRVIPSDFAVGDWLRRIGVRGADSALGQVNHWVTSKLLHNLQGQQ